MYMYPKYLNDTPIICHPFTIRNSYSEIYSTSKMRIVHNGRYIEIPNTDPTSYPLDMCQIPQLITYYGDPPSDSFEPFRTRTFNKHATESDYYKLLEQMIQFDAFDVRIINFIANQVIPDITHLITGDQLVLLLNQEVTFFDGVKILSYQTIDHINVSRCGVCDRDLVPFTHLRKLIISHSMNRLWFLVDPLTKRKHPLCHSLTELNAYGSNVKDDTLSHLTNLRSLNVNNLNVNLNFLSSPDHPLNDTLEELDISMTYVKENNIRHLRNLRSLSSMNDLVQFSFFLSDPDHLMCTTLTELDLFHATIDVEVMKRFRSLRKIDFSSCDVSLSFIDRAHPLSNTLEECKLIRSETDGSFLCHLRNLRVLQVSDDFSFSSLKSDSSDPLEIYRTLEDLRFISNMTDSQLQNFVNLRTLHCSANYISLSFVADHPLYETITNLEVPETKVTDEALSCFRKLTNLDISNTDIKLSFLEKHPLCDTITHIDVCNTYVTDEAIRHFRRLRYLRTDCNVTLDFLAETDNASHASYVRHELCDSLEELDASFSDISDKGLMNLRCLRKLQIDSTQITFGFITSKHSHRICTTLRELSCDDTNISHETIAYFVNLK